MTDMTALRAQWLTNLAEAIESAQRLAWQLGTLGGTSDQARDLYGKLEAARIELDQLRGIASNAAQAIDPDWLIGLGWSRGFIDPVE
ncbi:MAG TPA: hypothetical protein VFI88_00785 [Sphingomicrobium sp.]|jgi:hypothetical protein|nr:hypothetical protein [Sphingomicrobium sp.]